MSVRDEEIYSAVGSELTRFATALVGPNDAADLVSTVVLRVLTKRTLAELRNPRAYLMQAVANEARSHHRQNARRQTVPVSAVPDVGTVEAGTGDFVDLLMSLPTRQRAAAYLVFLEENTPAEAARLMGIRPGTVRRYLHNVRTRFEEALNG